MSLPAFGTRRPGPRSGTDYAHVVIDTGPSQEQLLRQAVSVTDALLVPVSPSLLDVRELGRVLQLVDDLGPARLPLDVRVLLTRVRANTASGCDARAGLLEQHLPLLTAQSVFGSSTRRAGEQPRPTWRSTTRSSTSCARQ